ncbi:hypothetical protein ACFSHT_10200 [Paraburkholderia silviterrae]|uniref:Uncharacterized protein n=1 Tax=Paraburkholderia silviterrae TaxID=2528715 RepID=A0A4R5MDY9_9BURK|nr:hypothetical protein [Paraburkholderia silviterrae]TDG25330.1 hypothetical protein EYW47_05690 [Paraburkholderia silviterrae]
MAEATQYMFTHREVVTALLKKQNIHEGIWALAVNLGFGVVNVGPSQDDINPTAMVPIMGIGIQKSDSLNALSVDAAEVNPLTE